MANELNPQNELNIENLEQSPHPLNIWWFSHYASTPDQQYTPQFDLAKRLVQKGHRVTFFASGFSHYHFKEIRLQPGEKFREEYVQGVRFIWLKTRAYRANDWRRAFNIASYAWRAYRFAKKLNEEPDLVIGTTFHPLAPLTASLIAKKKSAPFIFEVKDLWPLTMIQFGRFSSNSPAALALGVVERFLARRASRIITSLPGVADYFSEMGIPRSQVSWIPNGLDLARYESVEPYTGAFNGPCTLVYAGGHVSANALETVLNAAHILQKEGNPARFVFVGNGQDKQRLVQLASDLKLQNVEFNNVVPKSELPRFMQRADAFILTMRDLDGLYRYGMSFNKLCDYVAAGRPVMFAGKVSHNVVQEFDCGMVVAPEDPAAFADAVRRYQSLSISQRAQMGRNSLRCARERFDIDQIAARLEQALLLTAERESPIFHPGIPVSTTVSAPATRE
jgi:glycosyltransferase involved in cell wall biosynthesis